MKSEDITLYFRQGPADKLYVARLIEDGDGWVVNFAYGRRGKALKAGTKTKDPVSYEKAKAIYDKLVSSKTSKGYTPDEDGVAYSATPTDQEVTGMLPQLLNPIAEEHIKPLFEEWSYVLFQIKHDGERRMVSVDATGAIVAANRRGLRVGLQDGPYLALQELLLALDEAPFTIDCEDMGDHLVIFDVLSYGGQDLQQMGAAERNETLSSMSLVNQAPELKFDVATEVMNYTALKQYIHLAREAGEEGVVFKDPDEPYSVGRPNSGGPAFKFKFVESCTCVVLSQNEGKRSVQLGVREQDGSVRFIGNVTIPANYDIPSAGQYVEIEYLYAYPGEGSLYQPQYKGVRADKSQADDYHTLKFRES